MLPVKALRAHLGDLAGHRVAVLGLAFKPDTDDTRESPGIDIASLLLGEGATVAAYDPLALAQIDDAEFSQSETIAEAVRGASAVVIATEWQQIIEADWSRLVHTMNTPRIVYDGRNALSGVAITAAGGRYIAVGRPTECTAR